MRNGKLPIGVTESKTEPWFRYSRGELTKPKYFYYGTERRKKEVRAQVIAFALRENKRWTPKIEAARKGRRTKSNKSGVVGVSIKVEKGRLPGSTYQYWWARWPGCPSGVKFSILEHKNRKAFSLARIARQLESKDKAVVEREYLDQAKSGKSAGRLLKSTKNG
ncbi:hypothetical protein [Horticoccus sp. 23ND18S-11]|uniref:hypothetical protein n=1 Tax=Horticoccus sp. 23ND18S-11 TaxID=3391832 RepID=UPI0039C9D876